MPIPRTRTTAVATALLIAAMSLVGCSAGGADDAPAASPTSSPTEDDSETDESAGGEQTTAEACTQLQTSVQSLQEELQSSFTDLQTDPTAASAAITELSATFSASVDELENEEVLAAAEPADAALSDLATALETYVADPASVDPAAVTDTAGALQESFAGLQETCG